MCHPVRSWRVPRAIVIHWIKKNGNFIHSTFVPYFLWEFWRNWNDFEENCCVHICTPTTLWSEVLNFLHVFLKITEQERKLNWAFQLFSPLLPLHPLWVTAQLIFYERWQNIKTATVPCECNSSLQCHFFHVYAINPGAKLFGWYNSGWWCQAV